MSTLQQTLALLQGGVNRERDKLRGMVGAPQNRQFVNPGQGGMDALINPDQNQARALLAASLEMMGHNPTTMPGATMSRGINKGLELLDSLRAEDRQRGITAQALALEGATDNRNFVGDMYKTSRGTEAPANVREYQFFASLSPDEQEQYMQMKRSGQIIDLGGGGVGYRDPNGQMRVLVKPEEATTRDAMNKGAVTSAEGTSKTATAQVDAGIEGTWAAADAYAMGESMVQTAEEYLRQLDAGTLNTGPLDSLLYNWFGVGSEELASMGADQVAQALKNLQIVNLAPVTEKEMGMVMRLWADIAKQETPNRGLLKKAIEASKALMEKSKRAAAISAGRVQTYGGDAQFNQVLRSNPFLQSVYGSGGVDLSDMPGEE